MKKPYKPNGCGSSYWLAAPFRIPRWLSPGWNCCCDTHDIQYTYQAGKDHADKMMIECLEKNTERSPWWQRPIKRQMIKVVRFALSTKLSQMCYEEAGEFGKKEGRPKKLFDGGKNGSVQYEKESQHT